MNKNNMLDKKEVAMTRAFVTGGTGFLGKYLVENLLSQKLDLTLLVRNPEDTRHKDSFEKWRAMAKGKLEIIAGDVLEESLGLDNIDSLQQFDHFYHLAAIYDLGADNDAIATCNVQGTENVLETLANGQFRGCFHFVSSIAVAGDYNGIFSELMFAEGQKHSHTYNKSKYESEQLVREFKDQNTSIDVRIYRPSAIVGDSRTGYCERIDGPYYLFNSVSVMRRNVPAWMPLILPKISARMDMVPVDFVAQGLAVISLLKSEDIPDGQFCFHLTDPAAVSMTRLFNRLLKSADGPQAKAFLPTKMFSRNKAIASAGSKLKLFELIQSQLLGQLGVPSRVFDAMMPRVHFEASQTQALLQSQGVNLPPFQDYADTLWDFYNRHLDPAKNIFPLIHARFKGKNIVITGGSTGIGLACARQAVSFGANVALVARNAEKLDEARASLDDLAQKHGVEVKTYPCDIADLDACDALVDDLLRDYKQIDVLFNNAGKSIRRSIGRSLDRFQDIERTMQLNYYGSVRLVLGLLPHLEAQGGGHLIYSSTMGTLGPTPRFGAYLASKCAMDAFMDSLAAEYADRNVHVTSIKFPLVKTDMIAPTREYEDAPAASPEKAAGMFVNAVLKRPRVELTGTGKILGMISLWTPNFITQTYNYWYRIWPDAKGEYPEMELDRVVVKQGIPHSPI